MAAPLRTDTEAAAPPHLHLVAETHPDAVAAWRGRRQQLCRSVLAPKPRLTVSQWAEQYLRLSPDNTSQAGPYRYSEAPYLREIADFLSDEAAGEEGVALKSAQVGFTVGVLTAGLGYFIDQDPSPILLMQPTLDDAERYSKKKLMPTVRASPRLRERIAEARPGDARNTILQKSGPGWSLSMVGAKSPRQMRSDSIRIFLSDERSAYDISAGVEGNPYLLGRKRTDTFDNRKILTGSTPVVAPDETEKAYHDSDRRKWYVPCPHCGHEQTLKFSQLQWETTGEGDAKVHHPETAYYVCEAGGCVIEEKDKRRMVQAGRFIAENPGHRRRGWFINQLISLFPKARWANIAADWLDAQGDPEKLKIFYNTVLAESYEERGDRPDAEGLAARREPYPAPVPMRAGVLTASVDVQKDRVELLVKGWGAAEESWQVAHYRILGDPKDAAVWETLDRLRRMPYRHESGATLYIRACAVDSGDQTDRVYDYVKPRQREGVIAVKGVDDRGKPLLVNPAGKAKKKGVKLWLVGTHTAKVRLFSRLRIEPPRPGEPPKPGAIHFPFAQEDGLDDAYLKQFGNGRFVPRKLPSGKVVYVYKKTGPDEAIDLDVYALAALHALGDGVRTFLGPIAARLATSAPAGEAPATTPSALPSLKQAEAAPPPARPAAVPLRRVRRVRSPGIEV